MRNLVNSLIVSMAIGIVLTAGSSAEAVGLAAFSSTPATLNGVVTGGMPAWYQDSTGVAVQPCFDVATCGLIGLGDPHFNEALPLAYPTNFPQEAFYFDAVAIFNVGTAEARVVMALEYTFIDPVSGALTSPVVTPTALAVPFQRQRIILTYPPGTVIPTVGNFTLTNPWGVTTFAAGTAKCVNTSANTKCTMTQDLPLPGAIPPNFTAALGATVPGSISTFLKDPVAPAGYVGGGAAAASFTGAVAGSANSVTVTDPAGTTGTTSTLTLLVGKLFGMEVAPLSKDFGNLVIPNVAPTQTFTITNPNTVSGMTIPAAGGVALAPGAHNADFTITAETCTAAPLLPAIAPTDPAQTTNKCSVTIQFAPKPETPETANRTATLLITPSLPLNTPAGKVTLSGVAQYPVTALAGANGTITGTAVTAHAANAGSSPVYTVTPNPKWQVKDISVNGKLSNFTKATNPTQAVTFTGPALTGPQDIAASFMQSGNITGSGTLGINDAMKALKILVGIQAATGDDLVAMKVYPLDVQGRPSGIAGTPDLNDVVLILKRALGIISW